MTSANAVDGFPVAEVTAQPAARKTKSLKFTGSDRFIRELRKRVDAYFEQTGKRKRDCPQMYFKTATIAIWFISAYLLLLLAVHSWWLVIPLAIVLGVATAAIGFNIQHDGGHKAYSDRPWVNKLMAMSIDVIGGSSYLWDWKHNSIHHTYANIDGHDDDIDVGLLARLAPQQKRLWFHRAQGVYLWVLYGFLAVKWHLFDDFHHVATGRIGGHKIPRPKGKDLFVFVAGKAIFFSIAFVIPMMLHPVWAVLLTYALAAIVSGIVMAVTFQLAHCVETAQFPVPVTGVDGNQRMETDWALHQVLTTVDFARQNKFWCWLLGGLNFQVEHHLFSKICHIHYPELSKVVEEVCNEFGIRYNSFKSFGAGVRSHYRWLVEMGRPVGDSSQLPASN